MHINPFARIPLHAGRNTEGALRGHQRGQGGAHAGIGRRAVGQPRVVVGLGEMHHQAALRGHAHGPHDLGFHLAGIMALEELRVGPVHVGAVEEPVGHVPMPAQPLQKENGIGKLEADLGDNVVPDIVGNHVAGIATEPVHAEATPPQKYVGHSFPQRQARVVVQLGEILPGHPPRTGRAEAAVFVAREPLRVLILHVRSPAGVVGRNVHQEPSTPRMNRIDQLDVLLERRGASIELGQGRIDIHKIERGKGTAKATHTGVGRRHRMHR